MATIVLAASARADDPVTAATLEKRARQIFEIKSVMAEEATQWQEQETLFRGLIDVREKEIAEIDAFTMSARERVDEVSEKRSLLESEEAARKSWRADFEKNVEQLAMGMESVIPRLPAPVKDGVTASIQRLEADDTDEGAMQLQEKFRAILAILSAARDFDGRLTVVSEIREIGGEEREIDVLYAGLAQAWFVGRQGKVGGVGLPTDEGWVWKEDRAIAGRVREAIDVQRREAPPVMVSLPVKAGAAAAREDSQGIEENEP